MMWAAAVLVIILAFYSVDGIRSESFARDAYSRALKAYDEALDVTQGTGARGTLYILETYEELVQRWHDLSVAERESILLPKGEAIDNGVYT